MLFLSHYKKISFAFLFFLSLLLTGLWAWREDVRIQERRESRFVALAKTLYDDHLRMRTWISEKGGVYIPKNDANPTNPYLAELLGRNPDVELKNGTMLTLRDPAAVFREISEKKNSGIDLEFKLLSDKPVNPQNAFDGDFERAGFLRLQGNPSLDVFAFEERDGREYFKYLAPFVTEKACLKCHGSEGYKEGELRGAIRISFPTAQVSEPRSLGKPRVLEHFSVAIAVFCIFLVAYVFLLKSQRALAIAREDAEKSTAAKTQFVSNLSHDLRTPLGGILGMVDLLKARGNLSDEQNDCLSHIENSAEYMQRIVGDSLDISRIEKGKMDLQSIDFSPRELFAHLVGAFPEAVRSPGVSLSVSLDSLAPLRVRGDETRIQQILMNLVGNAVKFTNQGSIHVTCKFDALPSNAYIMRFTVQDTGPGISQDDLPLIFDPFVRAKNSARPGVAGSGLGLAIARQLARLMHGDITVKSELGRGTTFFVSVRVDGIENT